MIWSGPTLPASLTLGPKAGGLLRLREAGMPVPDFVVIPAETFDPLLDADAPPERQRQRLSDFRLSDADRAELSHVLRGWGYPAQAVVVRSSVADEDGARTSFAGLMDSFLHLTTDDALHAAIAHCAASAYGPRALAYRRRQGLSLRARPAVIVQREVMPEASGVCFSTFPEFPQETALHAVWGFGEGLVGGDLQPDEFYFDKRSGTLVHQVIVPKPIAYRAVPTGSGLAAQPVPAECQAVPCLSPAQGVELFGAAQRLERAFGRPQDLEFVVAEGTCWLVQARPITQPIPEVVVYDNSNIQESYCGVTTPLTFSFARRAYATVYRQTMRVLGLPEARIRALEPVVTNLLGLVQGRIYYHINHWYQGLQLLPSFRQNKADLERMMGLEEPVEFVTDHEKTVGEKIRMLPGLLVNLVRLLRAFRRLDRDVPAFQHRFAEAYRDFHAQPLDALGPAELLRWKTWLDERLLRNWTTPIVNDFYVMMTNGRVARGLRRAGFERPDEFLSRYLAGDPALASVQPTRRMQALAQRVEPDAALRALILAGPPDVAERIRVLAPAFHQEVAEFLDQYGDRTVGELKLETRTMRVDPAIFYKYLRNFLGPVPPAPTEPPLPELARRELDGRLAGRSFLFRRRLRADLHHLQRAIRYREALRLERTRLFGMYRALYRAMGRGLVAQNRLDDAEDVFFLTEDELSTALGTSTDLRPSVRERRAEFARYAAQDVPARVTVPQRPQPQSVSATAGTLRGTGCVAGRVEGEVRVITDPSDDLAVRDRIVCALRTDPGWAALFPTCRGVVIEKGSSLSHSVILLRELGIPTLINVPGLTRQLRSGDRVRIDGTTGEIERLP